MDRRTVWGGISGALLTIGATTVLSLGGQKGGIQWDSPWVVLALAALLLGLLIFTSLLWGQPFRSLRPSRVDVVANDARERGHALLHSFPTPDEQWPGGQEMDLDREIQRWVGATYRALLAVDAEAAETFGAPPTERLYSVKWRPELDLRLRRLNKL